MHIVIVLAALVALFGGATGRPATIRMHHEPHRIVPQKDNGVPAQGRWDSRIPVLMGGGVINYGYYWANISVGTGLGTKTFSVLVDTGSSNTAVPSVVCDTCQTHGGKEAQFNISLSPTSRPVLCSDPMCNNCAPVPVGTEDLPAAWNTTYCRFGKNTCQQERDNLCELGISYGGHWAGVTTTITRDVVCIDGAYPALCGVAYVDLQVEDFFPGVLKDGILGLAFPRNGCNPTCQPTFMDSLVAQGVLKQDENVVGMCLTPDDGGVLDVGAPDPSKYNGDLRYTNVTLEGWFTMDLVEVYVGSAPLRIPQLFFRPTNDAVGSFVDSGTAQLLVNPYVFSRIQDVFMTEHANLTGVKDLFGPSTCANNITDDDINKYPNVTIVVSGSDGTSIPLLVPARSYLLKMSQAPPTAERDGNKKPPHTLPPNPNGTMCFGIAPAAGVSVVLGNAAMERYYIVFDRAQMRVGFAPLKQCI